jgi:hypothetical protein
MSLTRGSIVSRWWSQNSVLYPDGIKDSSSLVEVFCSVNGGNQCNGSKLLHNKHIISSIFGDMTIYAGLRSSRADGFGALARQGVTAILNTYTRPVKYAYTPIQVHLRFHNALVNEQTATEFEATNIALTVEHSRPETQCPVPNDSTRVLSSALHTRIHSTVSVLCSTSPQRSTSLSSVLLLW